MRNRLLVGDSSMTGAALLRRMRQFREVRIVARHTCLAGIVHHRDNLRETGRSSPSVAMTEYAIVATTRSTGNKLVRFLNMLSRSTMASLARHTAMVGIRFDGLNIVVAVQAGLITCIGTRQVPNLPNCGGTVMAVLTKRLWNEKGSRHKQGSYHRREYERNRYDLLRNPSHFKSLTNHLSV